MLYTSTQLQELVNNYSPFRGIGKARANERNQACLNCRVQPRQGVANPPAHTPAPRLYDPMTYILSAGGKRLRPVLMLMAYNLFKDDPQTILPVAAGIETYHNYTLMHDDLMDNAPMRRGRETVHCRWDANTAILSGDAMLIRAYQQIASCPDDKLRPVIDLFSQTALEIGEGQQLDMEFEQRTDVSVDEYIEMIRLKTSVLLACSLAIGAILADAPEETQTLLYRFGESLGLAFQLQDDYLDVYGDPKIFGKAIGGDICNNKKTFLLISALKAEQAENAPRVRGAEQAENAPRVRGACSLPASPEKIRAVTDIYNRLGIPQITLQKIDHYFNEASLLLDKIDIEEGRKAELRRYADSLLHRQL